MTKKPKRPVSSQAPLAARVGKWLLIAGSGRRPARRRRLRRRSTRRSTSPTPTRTSRPRRRFVYYADGKTELGQFATQNRESIPLDEMPDTDQGRRRRRGEPDLLDRPGHRPPGHPARGVQQRPGQRHPGRVDDHPAVRQDPLPHPGAHPHPQGQGGDPLAEAAARDQQGADPRGLPQHHLLRPRRLRRPGGGEGLLRHRGQGPQPAAARGAGQRAQQPDRLRPGQRQAGQARTSRSATQYVLDGMAEMGTISAGEADQAAQRLPKFPEIERGEPVRRPARPRADDGPRRAGPARLHRGGDRGRRPARHHDLHPEGDGRGRGRASGSTARPEGFGDKELHVGVATVEPGTGAVRGFYGGQDYLDSQINWAVAGGQAGSTIKAVARSSPRSRTASRSRTPSTATRRSCCPTAPTSRTRATPTTAPSISMITATENSINTAFIDMTDGMENGPQKIVDAANRLGIPPAEAGRKAPGFPNAVAGPRAERRRRARQRHGQPDQHGQRLRHPRQRGPRGRAVHHREGRRPQRRDRYQHKVADTEAVDPDIAADVTLRAPAGRRERLRHRRAGARPAGGRQDRHRHQRQGRGVLVVVRRLHAAAVHRGDVRPRQGQRAARGLAAGVLRRLLPGRDLDRRDEPGDGGPAGRGVPRAGVRRRRRAGGGPRALHRRRRPRPSAPPPSPTQPTQPSPTQTQEPTTDRRPSEPTDADRDVPTAADRAPPPRPSAAIAARRRADDERAGRPARCSATAAGAGGGGGARRRHRPRPTRERYDSGDAAAGGSTPPATTRSSRPLSEARRRTGRRATPAGTRGGRRSGSCCSWPRVCFALGMVQKTDCFQDALAGRRAAATPTCATPTCPTSTPAAGWPS